METVPVLAQGASHTVTSFDDYAFQENNIFNMIESGRQWFGNDITSSPFDTTFYFPNRVPSSPVKVKVNALSRSASTLTFSVKANNASLGAIETGSVRLNDHIGLYGKQSSAIFTSNKIADEKINISVKYNRTSTNDLGWLDYIDVNCRRNLSINNTILFFRNMESVGPGNVSEFIIENGNVQTLVWDITDVNTVKGFSPVSNGTTVSFKAPSDELREYVAFDKNAQFLTPMYEKGKNRVENQNLHAQEPHKFVIVSNPFFIQQAEKLAQFHREKDNFSVLVTTTDKIYNEFSSGIRDVSAIRDFIRMLYLRSDESENALKYLLLFGDGSYNNILEDIYNPNFIPTYQSENSLAPTGSYVTDDFFGLLDENEGGSQEMGIYLLDIGIGRLPVKDTAEATAMVNKILRYNTPQSMLDWRNALLFLGDDDGNYNVFMEKSSELGDLVMNNYPQYNVKKVLLDAYKITTTSSGNRYPDVSKTLFDNFKKGLLIFNYIGHGGEKAITAEFVLTKEDLKGLKNKFYPLFITATCEFSRFDWIARDEKEITSRKPQPVKKPF
ncbi:MAG: type IX secretion system sortase PorU [Bacteroidales bacterium]|nr:type IX secretion system sortase PorU [Bacteroidales bacterium]